MILLGLLFVLFGMFILCIITPTLLILHSLLVGVVALLFWRHTLHDEFKDKVSTIHLSLYSFFCLSLIIYLTKEFKLNNAMERVKYDLSISNNKLKMKEDLIHSSIKAFNALATSSQREVDELRVLNQV